MTIYYDLEKNKLQYTMFNKFIYFYNNYFKKLCDFLTAGIPIPYMTFFSFYTMLRDWS